MIKQFILPPFVYSNETIAYMEKYSFLKENPPEHFIDKFLFCRHETINDDSSFWDSLSNMFYENVPNGMLHDPDRDIITDAYGRDIERYCRVNVVVNALGRYTWYDSENTPHGLIVRIMEDEDNEMFMYDSSYPTGYASS